MGYKNIGLFALSLTLAAHGQTQDSAGVNDQAAELENLKGQVESLNEAFLATKTTVDKLNKIKVSGYVQAQWQHADSVGAPSVAGGAFPTAAKGTTTFGSSDQRFLLRRGRLKTTYETPTSRYVLQIDVIPTGVGIKDAYLTVMEPWLKSVSATAGVFDRPFGYEISYSSSSRESPERARVFQAVFPGERDLGAKIELNPAERYGIAQYFNLKAGLFTGMGPTANENDKERDFIGRAGFMAPFYDLNLSIDGGASLYKGKVTSLNDSVYTLAGDTAFALDTTGNRYRLHDRRVYGLDAQVSYVIPVIGDLLGGTTIRGEYLWGSMPGGRGSNSPNINNSAIANRNFTGWYVLGVQNWGPRIQTVTKYDVYDPNTDVSGAAIGRPGSNLNAADVKFTTYGQGVIFHWDENVKLTAYYDIVKNESISPASSGGLGLYKKDLEDNVFTLRAQVKF
jgi:hypothetical protein